MKESAGLLLFRAAAGVVEVLLVHPGGPFFANRDRGAWGIPKGLPLPRETPLETAVREFHEETGFETAPPYLPLGEVRQKGGKRVRAWAVAGDCDPARLCSNEFEMEWPPRSGRRRRFPEVDRAAWFTLEEALLQVNPAQAPLLERLRALLEASQRPG